MMEKTIRVLKIFFWAPVVIALVLVAAYESNMLLPGSLGDGGTAYGVLMTMELLTLATIPAALCLFRLPKIHRRLTGEKAAALARFGSLRLLMIGAPLVANTYLYYLSGYTVAYAYLAIILVIVLPFVYPSKARCEQETRSEK